MPTLFISLLRRPDADETGACKGCLAESEQSQQRRERLGRSWATMIEFAEEERDDGGKLADHHRPDWAGIVRGNSRFDYEGRAAVQSVIPHSCAMGTKVPWLVPTFLSAGTLLPRPNRPMRRVCLEIVVRLAVSMELRGRWCAHFSVSETLDLPPCVEPWLGSSLTLEGTIGVRGGSSEQCRPPTLTWMSTGKVRCFGLPLRTSLREARWRASVAYGPRTNVELRGLAVKLMDWDEF